MPEIASGKMGQDASRLSMWTVIGAVAASVLTAGLLGGTSGILQIPYLVTEVAGIKVIQDQNTKTVNDITVRLRSEELLDETYRREFTQQEARLDGLVTRLTEIEKEQRATDAAIERSLSELEGRSKDRNTQVNGDVLAVRVVVDTLTDRLKAQAEALSAVRQNVYDLATRVYRQSSQQALPGSVEPLQKPYSAPNSFQDYDPRGRARKLPMEDTNFNVRECNVR